LPLITLLLPAFRDVTRFLPLRDAYVYRHTAYSADTLFATLLYFFSPAPMPLRFFLSAAAD